MFLLSLTLGLVADLLRQILRSWVSAFSGVGGVSVVCFSRGREGFGASASPRVERRFWAFLFVRFSGRFGCFWFGSVRFQGLIRLFSSPLLPLLYSVRSIGVVCLSLLVPPLI